MIVGQQVGIFPRSKGQKYSAHSWLFKAVLVMWFSGVAVELWSMQSGLSPLGFFECSFCQHLWLQMNGIDMGIELELLGSMFHHILTHFEPYSTPWSYCLCPQFQYLSRCHILSFYSPVEQFVWTLRRSRASEVIIGTQWTYHTYFLQPSTFISLLVTIYYLWLLKYIILNCH